MYIKNLILLFVLRNSPDCLILTIFGCLCFGHNIKPSHIPNASSKILRLPTWTKEYWIFHPDTEKCTFLSTYNFM